MNLLICLLVARTFVGREKIREVVPGYRDQSDEAFERMFERDKDELRDLGVPIVTGSINALFEDEIGYRILRSEFELPPIALEPDEIAVLGLAARMWQQSGLAGATSSALLKLQAAGIEVDREALSILELRVGSNEPTFWPLWQAVRDRRRVAFDYQKPGDSPQRRNLEPWSVLSWRGRWYVSGRDVDRAEPRLFRLSRIVGSVAVRGKAHAFEPAPQDDVRMAAASLEQTLSTSVATVRVNAGAGIGLRRVAVASREQPDGSTECDLNFTDERSFVTELAGYGHAVRVVAPETVRSRVNDHHRRTLVVLREGWPQ